MTSDLRALAERIAAGRVKHGVGASENFPGNVSHLVSPIVGTMRLRQRDGQVLPDMGWIIDRLSLVLDMAEEQASAALLAEPAAEHNPAPAAAGGEVEVWVETVGDATYPEDVPVPVDWWWTPEGRAQHDADLRRTERAEGAREAAERIAVHILLALNAKTWTPQWGRDDWRLWLRTELARAATEPTTTRPTDGDEAREVGG